jgi:HK97 family phage major capsid protein
MPLLRVEAEKLSENMPERGVIEEIIDADETFALLPFTQVNGKAYVYDRENTLPGATWLDPNEDVPESAATFTEVTARLRILIGDVDVDKFLSQTMSDINDQVAIQVAQKAKAVSRTFQSAFALGDATANTKQFDGISRLVTPAQTITAGANGSAVSLSMLDELKDAVILGADAFVMRRGTWRAIKSLLRAAGGNTAEMIQIQNFGRPVPAFDGIPVLVNDFLAANEVQGSASATTSIYAVRMNEADGLHGLYGGPSAGMVVENIGTVQNRDANRIRVKWYCGLALKSTRSLARIKGITNI